jgi:hypothetical protein
VTEQLAFKVVADYGAFELREYPQHIRVDVVAAGSFMTAGSMAFRPLLSYISGGNQGSKRFEMTAPVIQETSHTDASGRELHRVSFVLPLAANPDDVPRPMDSKVTTRVVPPTTVAALRFGGGWNEQRFVDRGLALSQAVAQAGLTAIGQPYFARFDPPWKPGFLKHNEALIDVQGEPTKGNK